ncbi:hypothetical protein [Mesonia maritima]|uniref:DUF4890 domain-containing protein n=1 Tax=Mesonia maritima TaxID=1793873 RepID=A0ABU1K517_9FLAO|nr:hypothetical protein [Mesonia maritima]MDR6300710.1 hypothetical protein [Mesonia maritima]
MKKIILLFTVTLLSFQFGAAQDLLQGNPSNTAEENAKEYTQYLKKELNLSGKQEVLVANTLKEHYMQLHTLQEQKKAKDMSNKSFSSRYEVLKENNMNRMHNILTEPQYNKYIAVTERQMKKAKKE